MRRPDDALASSVRAFRALTATPADGAATRARILSRTRTRRSPRRRLVLAAFATTALSVSASAAWKTLVPAWRGEPAIVLRPDEGQVWARQEPDRHHHLRTIPVVQTEPAPEDSPLASPAPDAHAEARLYARAHRAHFVDGSPAGALVAWTEYLHRFPNGALAPEAAFNRALCLVRLNRLAEADRALRAFVTSRPDGYRRADVERLLAWLQRRTGAPARGEGAGNTAGPKSSQGL